VSSLQLRFLGRPSFTRDGQPVPLASAKAVALLAYLAARRAPQPREQVLGLLWPESPAEAARKNLRNLLWALRKALGDDALAAEDERLSLSPAAWTDAAEFEQAAGSPSPAAIALYRGPFADGLSVAGAPDFEVWLTAERERLARLFLRVISTHIHAQRVAGNWRAVAELAGRALEQDNLQEPVYRALMEAHARLGQRAEAIRQHDALKATLARELGVEPLPETRQLLAAIQNGEVGPSTRPEPAPPLQLRREPPAGAGEPPPPAFVGRRAELAALNASLDMARRGQASVALVAGQMGIGKSRLWQEWSAWVGDGTGVGDGAAVVIATRCIEAARALPLAPAAELFRRRSCFQRLFSPGSPVDPAWLAEAARLLPEIRAALPGLPPPASLPPDEERRRLFEALVQCLLAVGGQPLVLGVDDAHWADHATLDWLGYAVHRLREHPFLLVLTYRPEDAGPDLEAALAGWGRQGLARRIELGRLSEGEAEQLAEALMPAPADRQRLAARSGGNPYFLIELSKVAPGDLSPELSDLIRARLARLPGPAQQVLQAAAVLEPEVDFRVLRRTSGRDEQETLDALDALLRAGVLAEAPPVSPGAPLGAPPSAYAFAHPLVAAVARAGLSGARRAFLNRRAAEAMAAVHAGRLGPVAGRLAEHEALAGDLQRAAEHAEMAAAHAMSLDAFAEAAHFYSRALEWAPTPARRLGLGWAWLWQGRFEEAHAAFQAARGEYEARRDWQNLARACLGLAHARLPVGDGAQIVRWVRTALGYLDVKADPAAHAEARFLLGAGLPLSGGSLAEAEGHLAEAARLAAENALPDIAARSRFELGNLRVQRGDLAGAAQAFDETIALSRAGRNQFQEVLGRNNAAYVAVLSGDLDRARRHVEEGLRLAGQWGLDLPRQWLYSTRGELALAEEQPDEAREWFERGLAESERLGNAKQAANFRANLGLAARRRGDLDAALALLESAREAAHRLGSAHLLLQVELWLAELHLERGDRTAADEALRRAEAGLAGGERRLLQARASDLRSRLTPSARS
jgi:DNA-binding SARP family transcriptional activator